MAKRLNLHIDESGNQDLSEGRYIVTVVLHDHSEDISTPLQRYEGRLASAGLPDVHQMSRKYKPFRRVSR